MNIAGREIGPDHPPYIVAEISANHHGSFQEALNLIEYAKNAKADAVKVQVYSPESMTIDCDAPDFVVKDGLWKGRKLWDLYKEGQTPIEWIEPMFEHASKLGIVIFASVFDMAGIAECERLNAPAYKVASFEIEHYALLRRLAQTGKPVIISTGMAQMAEISRAEALIGAKNAAILHCVSSYPCALQDSNLSRIRQLYDDNYPRVGFSDHTEGCAAAVAAVALGACIVEKHMTLASDTLDGAFSMRPAGLGVLAGLCRDTWLAMSAGGSTESASEQMRRSLYAIRDIEKDEPFTGDNIGCIRPAYGLHPSKWSHIMTQKAIRRIKRGTALKEDHLK